MIMDKANLTLNIELDDIGDEGPDGSSTTNRGPVATNNMHRDVSTTSVRPKTSNEGNCVRTLYCRLLCVGVLMAIIACLVWIFVCTAGGCDGGKCVMDCSRQNPWDYNSKSGPSCWGTCYSTCSTGKQQSPIDLHSAYVTQHNFTSELKLQGYSQLRNAALYSNSHTVELQLYPNAYHISGLELRGRYIASKLHFHWGKHHDSGSEHTIDGDQLSMEMHIVHYSANYSDIIDATHQPYGLAVLAFMFEISDHSNLAYEPIVDNLHNVAFPGQEMSLSNVNLSALLPDDMTSVYRYDGSLTTPGCEENAVWTVFYDTVGLSKSQVNAFQNSIYEDSLGTDVLKENYRPVQPLNERVVFQGNPNVDITP